MLIRRIFKSRLINYNPEALILFSFLTAILAGTLLLKLPISVQPRFFLSWIDAFFMATSATCITGLSVIDIGANLSLFGQVVILTLIQIGGLGIMTLSLLFLILLRRRSSLTTRSCLISLSNEVDLKNIRFAILKIFLFTISVELVGAILLFLYLHQCHDLNFAIYSSIFHSISSFCNAGLSIYSQNLAVFQNTPYVQVVVMVLVVLGGVGFIVINDVLTLFQKKQDGSRRFLSLHSKMALLGSAFLVIFGTLFIWFLERGEQLSQLPILHQISNAAFLSVTSRTAGFNTIDISLLSNATLFFLIILMFIGGSSGSTAGGVKVNTIFVLLCFVVSQLKGATNTNFLKRKIPNDLVYKAAAIVLISLVFIAIAVFVLQITEGIDDPLHYGGSNQNFLILVFEAVSAIGTVGLSMGATPTLSPNGKLIMIILMYIGRVGPLTLAFALQRISAKTTKFEHPEEDVFIG